VASGGVTALDHLRSTAHDEAPDDEDVDLAAPAS
jgi:hypothetical protein